jgi:hypothetical protein
MFAEQDKKKPDIKYKGQPSSYSFGSPDIASGLSPQKTQPITVLLFLGAYLFHVEMCLHRRFLTTSVY